MSYLLKLDLATTVKLKNSPRKEYLEFEDRPGSYLEVNNGRAAVKGNEVVLASEEMREQILDFFQGRLVLHRGVTRQHPLWYQLRYMGVLMPLGAGEMPSFATHYSRFIPFGVEYSQAEGIALGSAGMGPGDDRTMLANYEELLANVEHGVEVGAVIRVDVGPVHQLGFYNAGEIQVAGPLTDYDLFPVGIWNRAKPPRLDVDFDAPRVPAVPGLDPVPPREEVVDYLFRHGDLRHSRTVHALATSLNGANRVAPIAPSPTARRRHVEQLQPMRRALGDMIDGTLASLGPKPADRAPKHLSTEEDLRTFLECSVVRVAADGYVAAVVSARPGGLRGAKEHGLREAGSWLESWLGRSLTK